MKKTSVALSITALLLTAPLTAFAQDESDPPQDGWFEEGEEQTPAEEPEAAPEAEPKAEKAEPKLKSSSKKPQKREPARVVVYQPVEDAPKPKRDPSIHRHDGFYLRMSLGIGALSLKGMPDRAAGPGEWSQNYTTGSDYEVSGGGAALDLMIGGTPTPGLVIGGAYFANVTEHPVLQVDGNEQELDETWGFGMLGPFIDFYPNARRGFHLGGMLGGAAAVGYDRQDNERFKASGFGGSIWVGYDAWIAKQWSLGVMLRASAARMETDPDRTSNLGNDRIEAGSLGLMLTVLYH